MKVQKRYGAVVNFDPSRVVAAIYKAFAAVGMEDGGRSRKLAERVEAEAQRRFGDGTIGIARKVRVEDIHDLVERVLMRRATLRLPRPTSFTIRREARFMRLRSTWGSPTT